MALVSTNKTLAVLRMSTGDESSVRIFPLRLLFLSPRLLHLLGDVASLMFLRFSAPDQALCCSAPGAVCLPPCDSPLSPLAAGAVLCTTWDMVIISNSSFALRSPIAVLNSSREGTFDLPSLLPAGGSFILYVVVFRSLGRFVRGGYLKKNQNAPRPSEHPPVMGKKMSKRLGGIKGCKYKTSSWHLNRFPDADIVTSLRHNCCTHVWEL